MRFKQSYGKPVAVSGFAKYLPDTSEKFHIRVHELPSDEFKDCASTGTIDSTNPVSDLEFLHSDATGFAWFDSASSEISLYGKNSAIGKSVVLYEGARPDKSTENATERRIACCTITQTNFFN